MRVRFIVAALLLSFTAHAQTAPRLAWEQAMGANVHRNQVEGVTFSADGSRLASADNGGTAVLWDRRGSRYVQRSLLRGRNFTEIAFSPDGRMIAAAGFDSVVRVWRVNDASLQLTLHYPGRVEALALSADGRMLAAAGSGARIIRLWELPTGRHVKDLSGHTDDVYSVRFAPATQTLVSGGRDRTIRFWDLDSDRVRITRDDGDSVYALAYSRDGEWLASACRDGTVAIRAAATGARTRTLEGHTDSVHGVTFSPSGDIVATAGFDNRVILWSRVTGKALLTLTGHRAKVSDVAFAPDGRTLASAGSDSLVRLWGIR